VADFIEDKQPTRQFTLYRMNYALIGWARAYPFHLYFFAVLSVLSALSD
jgi:hypothetical protein